MITPEKQRVLDLFAKGRSLYTMLMFEEAKAVFLEALRVDPKDGPSRVYLARCTHYIEHPPAEDWDGVFVMTTK